MGLVAPLLDRVEAELTHDLESPLSLLSRHSQPPTYRQPQLPLDSAKICSAYS